MLLGGPSGAAFVTAVYGNGRIKAGKSPIPFAPGQEQWQADRDRLRRTQLFQDLQRGQPGDGASRHFFPTASNNPHFFLG
jgi:hypothetical protein